MAKKLIVVYFFAAWAISVVIKVRDPLAFADKAAPSAENAGSSFDAGYAVGYAVGYAFGVPLGVAIGSFLLAAVLPALIWLIGRLLAGRGRSICNRTALATWGVFVVILPVIAYFGNLAHREQKIRPASLDGISLMTAARSEKQSCARFAMNLAGSTCGAAGAGV
jgi:hypothetical protein